MYLENIVFDAVDPQRTGRFWQDLLGCQQLSDSAEGFETRYAVTGGPTLDLCFQPVPVPSAGPERLHLVLHGLAASGPDADQNPDQDTAHEDPEGNGYRILGGRPNGTEPCQLAAIHLDSAAPTRDLEFWSWLSGWVRAEAGGAPAGDTPGPVALQHRSQRGPLLEFVPAPAATEAKNRVHLDVRLESGEDAAETAALITARGGRELHPDWGVLPWRVYQDPSGNEFCVLPAPVHPTP